MNHIGYYYHVDDQHVENWIDRLTPEQKILLASGLLQVGIDEQIEAALDKPIDIKIIDEEPDIIPL